MGAPAACSSCATALRPAAKFCDECGTPTTGVVAPAEYKQVTVLFADVVRSMDLAAVAGPERLREIMAELVALCTEVVRRYGGTVDKFTGDGIMAVFGAPKALEDHAVRACRAALDIQARVDGLSQTVRRLDGFPLCLRVGVNSGQVIAGEIGSGPGGYTAIGAQVGMAQRMESAAPPGGVLLSESTAHLVEQSTILGQPQTVVIKGSNAPVPARQLLGMTHVARPQRERSDLVGRDWELAALAGLLSRAVEGHGSVVGVVGPPGIGKSRLAGEIATLADRDGVAVVTSYCESHTSDVPFHAAAELLRAALDIADVDKPTARARVRAEFEGADPEDLALVDDLLDIAESDAALPAIDPDARRRRFSALINEASIAREWPAVYVLEDVHWVDPISESMLADFFSVIPRTRTLVVVTYRPEYTGVLARSSRSQTIALEPLRDNDIVALTAGLLGADASVAVLIDTIADRAAGNPFFAEEIVRDLAEQEVLLGARGGYQCARPVAEVSVPSTLQSVIAARIDRLDAESKRTLNAAAVIGSRFSTGDLAALGVEAAVDDLLAAELIDQIAFGSAAEYAFRHPLIRAVAYESQLSADRADLHRRVAAGLEQVDSNAALIAEHLESAGDDLAAYLWHMRAGAWAVNRDLAAAQLSWERALVIADDLPADDPEYLARRIAPRTMLCGNAFRRVHADMTASYEEARMLCAEAGDKASLAVIMAGQTGDCVNQGRVAEASQLASQYMNLVESLADPALMVGLVFPACIAKLQALQCDEVMRWSDAVVALAEEHGHNGTQLVGSPLTVALTFRSVAGWASSTPGWREDLDRATALMDSSDLVSRATVIVYKYIGVPRGVRLADDAALTEIEEALKIAERTSDDIALILVRVAHVLTLFHHSAAARERAYAAMSELSRMCMTTGFAINMVPLFGAYLARRNTEFGDYAGAVRGLRTALDDMMVCGNFGNTDVVLMWLIETLLERGGSRDLAEAEELIGRFSSDIYDQVPASRTILTARSQALLAYARGDDDYSELRQRYLDLAIEMGFDGQRVWAEEMPETLSPT